jgi:hypothetical protein
VRSGGTGKKKKKKEKNTKKKRKKKTPLARASRSQRFLFPSGASISTASKATLW